MMDGPITLMLVECAHREGCPHRWTTDQVDTLRHLVAQQKYYDEIAEVLGRTHSSVKTKAQRLGIGNGHKSGPKETKKFQPGVGSGLKGSEIWNWRGGNRKLNYSGHWQRVVQPAVFERDAYTCLECKLFSPGVRYIVAHHIVPARYNFRRTSLSNHATLCRPCHRRQQAHNWPETELDHTMLDRLPAYQLQLLDAG